MPTMLEIALGRQTPLTAGILSAVRTRVPALLAFDARVKSGIKYQTLAMTALPTASGFKHWGEGFGSGTATLALREFEAKLIGAKVQAELITARRWDAEHEATGRSYFGIQFEARMQAEMKHLEKVLFYGTAIDEKAFPGMKQLTPFTNTLTLGEDAGASDYTKSVINVGGSTAGAASSVYSVVFGEMDCQLVVCDDGQAVGGELFAVGDVTRQHIAPNPSAPDDTLEHDIQQIYAYFGLSVSGMNQAQTGGVPTQYSVRRLANLTAQADKTLDDYKLEQLVMSHNDGVEPSVIFMNGRSGQQLADSRSATTVTVFLGQSGDAKNNVGSKRAKRPDNFEGIPIVYTSSILSTDAIEA